MFEHRRALVGERRGKLIVRVMPPRACQAVVPIFSESPNRRKKWVRARRWSHCRALPG